MRCITVISLLVVCCVCLSVAQVSFDDCCLKYAKKLNRNTQRHVVRYRMQVTDGGCNLPAVIFTLRKGRVYCANPTDKWVIDLMNLIDKKQSKRYGRKPYKG